MRFPSAAAILVLLAAAAPGAVQFALDARAIDEAIGIGQSRIELQRTRFHAPYRLQASRAPVDYIEVITPFRRVALAAEARVRIGDRSFGQRQAFELLAATSNQIELWVELTFHPLNTFVGVPGYAVSLERAAARPIPPRRIDRVPRYGARVDGELPFPAPGAPLPGGSEPMLGGIIVVDFDGRLLTPDASYDVVVRDEGKELARVRMDLARLR